MIERWYFPKAKTMMIGTKRIELPCRNAGEGCTETTTIEHTKHAELPKRYLCKICEKSYSPLERRPRVGGRINETGKSFPEYRGVSLEGMEMSDIYTVTAWPSATYF